MDFIHQIEHHSLQKTKIRKLIEAPTTNYRYIWKVNWHMA